MAQSPDTPIALDPAALDSFAEALEQRIETRLSGGVADVEGRFFPAGRGDEQRPFGRSPHHPGQRDLGVQQQRNAAAHVDEMTRLREAIAGLRHGVRELRARFNDAEQAEQALNRQFTDAMTELEGPR